MSVRPQLCARQPTFLSVGAACQNDSWCATQNCISVTLGKSGTMKQICLPQTCASHLVCTALLLGDSELDPLNTALLSTCIPTRLVVSVTLHQLQVPHGTD